MNNLVPTFPLLRLPIDAVLKTFRTMDYLQLFGISLLSKKMKNLVQSLELTIKRFQVDVTDCFEIHLIVNNPVTLRGYSPLSFRLYQVPENGPLQGLDTPTNVNLLRERFPLATWTNSMSVKDLFDHLKLIFHNSKTTLVLYPNCERFFLESIHKSVKGIQCISLGTRNHEHNKRAISLFKPIALTYTPSFVDVNVPEDLLVQNFEIIFVPSVRITLNDLLITNIRIIWLAGHELATGIPNRFLKLWTKGSNPRLENVHFRFPGNLQNEEVLSGLKYQDAPRNTGKLFKSSGNKEPKEVIGGWDIWRFDGTKATITVEGNDLHMFVWHDHCVAN